MFIFREMVKITNCKTVVWFKLLSYYHKDNLQDLSCIQIYFLDSCEDPGSAEEDYPLLRKLEEKHMVNMGSLASLDPVQGCNKRDDARAKPWVRAGGN